MQKRGNVTTDHLGQTWISLSAMLKHYNVTYTMYQYRLNTMHMTLEEALTTPSNKTHATTSIESTDHEGNTYKSVQEMCDHWRIPRTAFFRRRRNGWDLKKCLTTPLQKTEKNAIIHDAQGNSFTSVDEMCAYHNISKQQYIINIRNNCSVEEALTRKTENKSDGKWKKTCTDHKGNEYPSINAMCKAYHISKDILRGRIELGWTLDQILENPNKIDNRIKAKDHKQQKYQSQKEMLKAYGISEFTFKHRKARGLDLEQCLSKKNLRIVECKDHMGNKFSMLKNMLLYWNCKTGVYHSRINHGESTKHALTYISYRRKNFAPGLDIEKQLSEDYYEVTLHQERLIMHSDELFAYYREHCLPNNGEDLIEERSQT